MLLFNKYSNNVINNGDNLPRFELLSSVSDNSIRDEINNANNLNEIIVNQECYWFLASIFLSLS